MRTLVVEQKFDCEHLKGKFLTPDMVDTWLTEPTRVLDPDGHLVAVFDKHVISKENAAAAWSQIKSWNPKTNNRGTSSGVKHEPHKKKDGTISNTMIIPDGMAPISGVMGYYDRYPRIPYCRACAWNLDNPEGFKLMLPLAQQMDAWHAKNWPETYAVMKEMADQTHPDFKIPGTAYTTITMNKNYRTACHRDPKNLPGAHSSMAYLQQGKLVGGDLIFPEYRIGVKFESGDAIIFNNQAAYHGNTAITKMSKNAVRCTLVFYYRAGMIACGSAEEELERAKRRQKGESLT